MSRKVDVTFDEKTLDGVFTELDQCHLPGAAVGLAIDGRVIYRKGFGLANMELPCILSPGMRMRIASITKHFTCLAYMLLCEEGKARLDDPVGKYLPEVSAVCRRPTVGQLMTHTSGLRDACDWFFYDARGRVTSDDILQFYCELGDVDSQAGNGFRYNDGAYLLLGLIIERISGERLEDILRKRIFEPAGMTDTLLRRWDDDFVPHSAVSHMPCSDGKFRRVLRFNEGGGQGGIVSTADDMLRWLAHMDEPVVGTAATWTVMQEPRVLANGTSSGFGLSLITGKYRGLNTLWHSGLVLGSTAQMLKVPAAGLDIIVMTNRHDVIAGDLAYQIVDACVPNLPAKPTLDGRVVSGIFHSSTTNRVIQLFRRGAQQIAAIDGVDLFFDWTAYDVLVPSPSFSYRKYSINVRGESEKPSSIIFSDYGNAEELVAIAPCVQRNVCAVVGRYRSDATNVEAIIYDSEVGPRLSTISRFGSTVYQLECLAAGIWRARSTSVIPQGGILSFDAEARDFRMTTSSTRSLSFKRL